jgi:hypothetical protein
LSRSPRRKRGDLLFFRNAVLSFARRIITQRRRTCPELVEVQAPRRFEFPRIAGVCVSVLGAMPPSPFKPV